MNFVGRRILVVDDELKLCRLLTECLSIAGAETEFRTSPALGVEAAAAGGFDLVMVDMRMPGMTGLEFIQALRRGKCETAIVVVSGCGDLNLAVEAMRSGALNYVSKPFDLSELRHVVGDALGTLDRSREESKEQEAHLARQTEMLYRLQRQLSDSADESLEALVAALDFREHETHNHSRRVSDYAVHLAQTMNMTELQLSVVRRGSLLHDVGKIGVPDGILLKRGKLSSAEWEQMRRHPEIGYQILQNIDSMRQASEIALTHHERFDGMGYPHGLKGREIPLESRIFSIVDTLDAMTSHRTYRRAVSFADAFGEIRRCAGLQFDPEVVASFFKTSPPVWAEIRSRTMAEPAVAARLVGPCYVNDDSRTEESRLDSGITDTAVSPRTVR